MRPLLNAKNTNVQLHTSVMAKTYVDENYILLNRFKVFLHFPGTSIFSLTFFILMSTI